LLPGLACPHYNSRPEFDDIALDYSRGGANAYAICDNSAAEFTDGKLTKSIGEVYVFERGVKRAAREIEG
jgi:hypothetical protein